MKRTFVRATFVGIVALGSIGAAQAQTVRRVQLPVPTPSAPVAPPGFPALPAVPDVFVPPPAAPAMAAPPVLALPQAPPAPLAPPSFAVPQIPAVPPTPPVFGLDDHNFDFDFDFDFQGPSGFDLHDLDVNVDFHALSEQIREQMAAVKEATKGLKMEIGPQAAPRPAPRVPQPPQPPEPPTRFLNGSSAEALYEQALNYIDRAQYERAIDRIDQLIQRFDQGGPQAIANKVDGAYYWKAYTQVKQKQIGDALSTLEIMQKKYGDSRWMKDAKTLELEARQASGQAVSPDAQSDEELKLLALRGLMQSDPERGVPMIEQLLAGNSSVKVKENALFVLSQSRSTRAREIISSVAKGGGNPDLQLRAVRYLGAMGGPENRQILQDVYRSTNDVSIKRAVIRSFVPSGDRERLLAIAKSESNAELRGEAIRQLGAMRATVELSDFYSTETSPDVKRVIIQSLFVSGASDKLLELAKTEKDPQLRRTAIRNLGQMNAARTGDTLKALYASEPDPENKKEVINALYSQRNATALVDLARGEKDQSLKREIVQRLGTMRDKVATDYLIEILK